VRLPRAPSIWALLLILLVVASFALMQYRWISRVAEVEEQTSRQRLESSLQAFADDFDTEITRVHFAFAGVVVQSAVDVLGKARERLQVFKAQSAYPALVRSVDLEEGVPDPNNIDRGPPPSLTAAVAFALVEPLTGAPFSRSLPPLEAGGGIGFNNLPPAPARPVPLRIRVALDEKYIVRSLLPQLLERHFGPTAHQHYDVLIQSAPMRNAVLRWGSERSGSWERTLGIFTIRPDCLLGQTNQTHFTAADLTTQNTVALLHQPGRCVDRPNPAAGIWIVNIRAHPSLSEVVESARRQNLVISFGVLLGLATALAVLAVTAHRARELAALHEQFAASVSHELITPLSVISSASQNLADGVVENSEQMRRYGKMILVHSEQLSEMIENVLWFARKDSRDDLEVKEVDVEELIDTAAGTCSRILEDSGVTLERSIEQGLPAICGNRTLLLHCLQNLLTNVAKHGQSGKWARIRAAREGSEVAFTIEDRGDGIPSDDVAHVFDPFYRGAGAKQTRVAGLGLGLNLVRKIVEAHSGRIQLRSSRTSGTTVRFTVPIVSVAAQEPDS
jgi:signal transduction histidine kinase